MRGVVPSLSTGGGTRGQGQIDGCTPSDHHICAHQEYRRGGAVSESNMHHDGRGTGMSLSREPSDVFTRSWARLAIALQTPQRNRPLPLS